MFQALNELSEKQNWPIEFVDGFIDKLFVSVPFMSILKDPSYVEVQGLKITVQPKQRHESGKEFSQRNITEHFFIKKKKNIF